METHSSSLSMISGLVFFILFVFMLRKFIKKSKPSSKLPPGPWKLPLLGNLHQLVGSEPHRALTSLARKHGPLMFLKFGEVPTVVVSSAEYAKEIMKTHDIFFASRPQVYAAKVITYNFTSVSSAPYGEYWRQLRKICTVELLSANRVELLRPIREEEMSKFIKSISSYVGSPVDLTDVIFSAIYASVSRMLFRYKSYNATEFTAVVRENSLLTGGFSIADVFPSLQPIIPLISGINSKLKNCNERSSTILDKIIDIHLQDRPSNPEDEDLVDVLLKSYGNDVEKSLTKDNIKVIIQDIFGGGGDTSALTVDWAMAEMVRDQRIMKKAQEEVRRVFDRRGENIDDNTMELEYLKLVIKETLRLHPPLPLLLPRENSESREINGYEIPEKTRVIVNAWAIGRDPQYWGVDADKFYPERFVDNPIDFKGANFQFIPFGAGRRVCPGMTFGLSNVEFLLSQLLYNFDWRLPNDVIPQDIDMTDEFGTTMRRRDHLYLIPTTYHPPSVSNP